MSDLWNEISVKVDDGRRSGDWLYQVGRELRGPCTKETLGEKLARGEISPDTLVAREGAEFKPISTVPLFAKELQRARVLEFKKARRKRRMVFASALLVALVVLAWGLVELQAELTRREAQHQRLRNEHQALVESLRTQIRTDYLALPSIALVPLAGETTPSTVSDDKPTEVVKPAKTPSREFPHAVKTKPTRMAGAPPAKPRASLACERSQAEILSVLAPAASELNACVEFERSRSPDVELPPSLLFTFDILPDGRIAEFAVEHAVYRKGPMNNCLLKVFRKMAYPEVDGGKCPVRIPIKI